MAIYTLMRKYLKGLKNGTEYQAGQAFTGDISATSFEDDSTQAVSKTRAQALDSIRKALRQTLVEIDLKRQDIQKQYAGIPDTLRTQKDRADAHDREQLAQLGLLASGETDVLKGKREAQLQAQLDGVTKQQQSATKSLDHSERLAKDKQQLQTIAVEGEFQKSLARVLTAQKQKQEKRAQEQDKKAQAQEKEQFNRMLAVADRLGWLNNERTINGQKLDMTKLEHDVHIEAEKMKHSLDQIKLDTLNDPESIENKMKLYDLEKLKLQTEALQQKATTAPDVAALELSKLKLEIQKLEKSLVDVPKSTKLPVTSTKVTTTAPKAAPKVATTAPKVAPKVAKSIPKVTTPQVSTTKDAKFADYIKQYKTKLEQDPEKSMEIIKAIQSNVNLTADQKNRLIATLNLGGALESHYEH